MRKKIIGILVCMLLIATAIPIVGAINKTIVQNLDFNYESQIVDRQLKIPNDIYFKFQWSLNNSGQLGGTPDCDIDAPEAWEAETGASEVVIAVIDTGVYYTHPDLEDNIWINDDEIPDNGIDDDGNGYIDDIRGWNFYDDNNDPDDYHYHGTHCSGIAGAVANNGKGIAGVCWDCQIMPLKKSPGMQFNLDEIIEAIYYAADNGADIITMSFGTYVYEESLDEAVNYAYGKGVFMCGSAGNDDSSVKRYPAAFDNVVAVAATNYDDERMEYDYGGGYWVKSNYGDWVDVAAPGQQIYSTAPPNYGYYDYLSGTSMAAPHVAGLAALLLSGKPEITNEELKDIICSLSNVDPYNSEYDLGSGRINANKAIRSLSDLYVEGGLHWVDVSPGETVYGELMVKNIGVNSSLLDWSIAKKPSWGEWTFNPMSGTNLEKDIPLTINVTVIADEEKNSNYSGQIKIQNQDFENDFCIINASMSVKKNKPYNINSPFQRFFEQHPFLFLIFRQMVGL